MAARSMLGEGWSPVTTTRFRQIFELVSAGEADIGVVPLENALAGSVHENYDLLAEFELSIVAEHYCPVQLHLMSGGSAVSEVRQVVSHPKALEQCSNFLESRPGLEQVNFSDTAGAALHVKESEIPGLAAIASEEAASAYGLTIIARSIQNHAVNSTRFVAVSRGPAPAPDVCSKCSLLLTLPHVPGSLARLLSAIAASGGDVTKIESRPILGKPFEYRFYLDVKPQDAGDGAIRRAVQAAQGVSVSCRVLGAYTAAASAF